MGVYIQLSFWQTTTLIKIDPLNDRILIESVSSIDTSRYIRSSSNYESTMGAEESSTDETEACVNTAADNNATWDSKELQKISEAEAEDTFQSITDLDGIADTSVLAITFLLSAEVTLVGLVLNSDFISSQPLQMVFSIIALSTTVLIFLSFRSIVLSLLPVGFNGKGLAEASVCDVLGLGDDSDRGQNLLTKDRFDTAVKDTDGKETYQTLVTDYFSRYGAIESIESENEYIIAKLTHYKVVGARKAKFTKDGLTWLLSAVGLFLLEVGFLLGIYLL